MHRPRYRYGQGDDATETCGRIRLLAALSFDPKLRTKARIRSSFDSRDPKIPLQDYIYTEGRYRMLAAKRSGRGESSVGAGSAGCNASLAAIQKTGRFLRTGCSSHRICKWKLRRTIPAVRRTHHESINQLSRSGAEEPDCGFFFSAVAHRGQYPEAEDAGASAVVMYSLFEEQITFDQSLRRSLPAPQHEQLRRVAQLLS